MTCHEIDELAGALAFDALDVRERAAVEDHLQTCTETHAEARDAQRVSLSVPDEAALQPPSALRSRVMASIAATPQAHRPERDRDSVVVGDVRGPRRTPWTERLGWLRPVAFGATAAALVLAVATGVLWGQLNDREEQLRQVAQAIAGGGAAYRVEGPAGVGFVVDGADGAVLVLSRLDDVADDQHYALWLIDAEGQPLLVGRHVDVEQAPVTVIPIERDPSGFATFAVTIETAPVEQPTSDPVIVGQLET